LPRLLCVADKNIHIEIGNRLMTFFFRWVEYHSIGMFCLPAQNSIMINQIQKTILDAKEIRMAKQK